MPGLGRWLLVAGAILVAAGLLVMAAERLGLFRLPGDVVLRGERTTVYLPIVTSLVLSLLLTLLLALLRWWKS